MNAKLLCMSWASASVVLANSIPVISPDVSELLNEVIIIIVFSHLFQEISLGHFELLQNALKSDKGEFGLKEVGSIQAVQTISPKYSWRFLEYTVIFIVENVVSEIDLHFPDFFNDLINILILPTWIIRYLPLTLLWKS